MNYIELIMNQPLLASISQDSIINYLDNQLMKISHYPKGSIIHLDSDLCHSVDLILKGEVHIDRIDLDGRLLSITTLTSGEFFGGNTLFSSNPVYLMTISSKTYVTILTINKACIIDLLEHNSIFLMNFLKDLSDRASILGNHIRNYNSRSLRDKLISYLEYQHKIQKSASITLPISKTSLADHMGVARTSLSRELRLMSQDGLIKIDNKIITLIP